MNMKSEISWYSLSPKLSTVENGPIGKVSALEIIDGYFSRLKPKYESGEDAISATMFGFQKSKNEFIEICINGLDSISFKFEISTPKKVLFFSIPSVFQKEITLRSIEEVKSQVGFFYDLDSDSFKVHIQK